MLIIPSRLTTNLTATSHSMKPQWEDSYKYNAVHARAFEPVLRRIGYKHFIAQEDSHRGAAVLAHYKCGYPEALRRFTLFKITRRVLK